MSVVAKKKAKPVPPPPPPNPWPARLRAIREAVGERENLGRVLLQAEAAARIGVSRRTWIAWETGSQPPSKAHAKLIDFIFGSIGTG